MLTPDLCHLTLSFACLIANVYTVWKNAYTVQFIEAVSGQVISKHILTL